jgi:hypothetical protein
MVEKVKTNNVPRQLLSWCELSAKHQADFGDSDEFGDYFIYRGEAYSLADFCSFSEPHDWDGHFAQSYFDAIYVKLLPNHHVIVGHATW